MDDESVTLPPTAVERKSDGLTRTWARRYMDVDRAVPERPRPTAKYARKRTVRLLERLFAPPVGTINVEEAGFSRLWI